MINQLRRLLGLLGYQGLDNDLVKLKQAEEALRESEEQYRSIVESIGIGITLIDQDHKIVAANAEQGRIFHKPASELVGKNCFEEFEKREAVCPHCPGVQAIATGCAAMVETRGIRDDGSFNFARIRAFPVLDAEGTSTSFIEVVEDITERKQAMEEVERLNAQIRETAAVLSASAAEILAATTQQATGASEQSAAISQTTTTVDEVKSISEQAIQRAQEVVDASQRTVETSRVGQNSVQDTVGSMVQIKVRVEGIAENILALSEQTQQIGEIISSVNDIAAQSNMLALNASVEAARAGEHGKGFAVVAAEVRSLAEQSRQATERVKQILLDIQNGINATVMATEEGTKVVEQGLALAAKTGEVIGHLADAIDEASQVAIQMRAGGQQQATGVEQIALAMQNINQTTAQSLASTLQAEKAAQDLNDLASTLTQVVEQSQL
jgi:PAS domain S-box-containing protein